MATTAAANTSSVSENMSVNSVKAPQLSGWLKKAKSKPSVLGAWNNRFFVVDGETNQLQYYRTDKAVGSPAGVISLSSVASVAHSEDGLVFVTSRERSFTLKAASAEEARKWSTQLGGYLAAVERYKAAAIKSTVTPTPVAASTVPPLAAARQPFGELSAPSGTPAVQAAMPAPAPVAVAAPVVAEAPKPVVAAKPKKAEEEVQAFGVEDDTEEHHQKPAPAPKPVAAPQPTSSFRRTSVQDLLSGNFSTGPLEFSDSEDDDEVDQIIANARRTSSATSNVAAAQPVVTAPAQAAVASKTASDNWDDSDDEAGENGVEAFTFSTHDTRNRVTSLEEVHEWDDEE